MRVVFHVAASVAEADRVELLRNMIRTSGLVFAGAKQNRKEPRIAYGPGVKRGQFAQREYVDIYLFKSVSAIEAKTRLDAVKPQGVTILEVERVPYSLAGVQQLASVAAYEISGDFGTYVPKQTIENYVSSAQLTVTQQAPNGICLTKDIKLFVRGARTLAADKVELVLNRVGDKWINPCEVLQAWLGIEQYLASEEAAEERFRIIRKGLYWIDSQSNLHLI